MLNNGLSYGYQPYALPYPTLPTAQPNMPTVAQQQGASSNIFWIQGEAAASAFQVAAGNKVVLLDSAEPVAYVKETDASNRPLPMEVYDLVKREANRNIPQIDMDAYVRKDTLETLIAEVVGREVDRKMSEISFTPAKKQKKVVEVVEE